MQDTAHTSNQEGLRPTAVAVIGAGTMGSAVASRLLGAGMTVLVWDRNPSAAMNLVALGASAFTDPKDAVAEAPVVLTWLPTAEAVREVMIGRQVVDAMAAHAVWAQMGTVGLEATQSIDAEVHARRPDVSFVDAPVSGSRLPAESGTLLVLASGPEAARAILGPVFDAVGRRTLWLGAPGTGSRVKLVLNTWLAFEVEAAAEAAAVAVHLGVAPEVLIEAADANPLASPLAVTKLTKIQADDHSPDFALEWALKDLDLMRASVGAEHAPIAHAIAERWRNLVDEGLGVFDVSAAGLRLDGTGAGAQAPVGATGDERRKEYVGHL
jgi:3-hydroxyisobutyrate dehydrogenase